MEYRQLGRTGLRASVLGVGAEHLKEVPSGDVAEIFRLAFREGVNYVDLVWGLTNILEGLRDALDEEGGKTIIAYHLGSCVVNGKYRRSRDPRECEIHLRTQMAALDADCAPLVNVHYVSNVRAWKDINCRGIFGLAEELREKGVAGGLSVSTHDPGVMVLAAEAGADTVMYQVNASNEGYEARDDALATCRDLGVGVVAMKPFAGGHLLGAGKKVRIPAYKTGWKARTLRVSPSVTPVNLLGYTLSQPGVCTAVTGVSSIEELVADLAYLKASEKERDPSRILEAMAEE